MREILFLIPILFCPFLFALAPQSNLVDIPPNSIIKFAAEVEKVKPLILQAGEAILRIYNAGAVTSTEKENEEGPVTKAGIVTIRSSERLD